MEDLQVMVTLFVIVIGETHAIGNPVSLVGSITVPGSLLVIGSSLAEVKFGSMLRDVKVYVTALFRLFIIPLGLYGLFRLCGASELVNEINTVVIAMPVAAFGVIYNRVVYRAKYFQRAGDKGACFISPFINMPRTSRLSIR